MLLNVQFCLFIFLYLANTNYSLLVVSNALKKLHVFVSHCFVYPLDFGALYRQIMEGIHVFVAFRRITQNPLKLWEECTFALEL